MKVCILVYMCTHTLSLTHTHTYTYTHIYVNTKEFIWIDFRISKSVSYHHCRALDALAQVIVLYSPDNMKLTR